jgi:hypothetical protein
VADKGYTVEERQHRVVRDLAISEERIQRPHIAVNGLARYSGLARVSVLVALERWVWGLAWDTCLRYGERKKVVQHGDPA